MPALGITGDINLLEKGGGRLQAVTTAADLLFGGDPDWLGTKQDSICRTWLTEFYADVQASPDGTIDSAAETQLLATTLPSTVSTSEATEFIDRWNRTVAILERRHLTAAAGADGREHRLPRCWRLQSAFNAAQTAEEQKPGRWIQRLRWPNCQADLTDVQNDLSGMGVCATIKLQIDQTATLTRVGVQRHVDITNSEGTGAMTNVRDEHFHHRRRRESGQRRVLHLSPTYSGAFSVVNGIATLPDSSTGTIAIHLHP